MLSGMVNTGALDAIAEGMQMSQMCAQTSATQARLTSKRLQLIIMRVNDLNSEPL